MTGQTISERRTAGDRPARVPEEQAQAPSSSSSRQCLLLGGHDAAGATTDAAAAAAAAKETEAQEIGVEACVYGYPLVTMEMTRRVMTNVAKPEGTRAPMGQLVRMREYPTAAFRDVTAPNADTLYTTAWVDVSKEPWVLITGPGWTGTPQDYKEVHALQDKVSLVPLSAYGKKYTSPPGTVDPAIDMENAVRDQVDALGGEEYFAMLASLLKTNPPSGRSWAGSRRASRRGTRP